MDPIQMLKDDHKKVKGLFRQFEQAKDGHRKKDIAEKAFREITVHTTLEEEIFYPAVQQAAGEAKRDLLAESYQEHHVVDLLIKELQDMSVIGEAYEAKFKVMTENVEHHIKEEEEEMLPDAEKRLGEDRAKLGEAMGKRRRELMTWVE